jgi:hypothetical protein
MIIGNRIEVADAMMLRQPAGDDRSGGKSAESVVQAWATDGDGENISATVCGFPRRCAIRRWYFQAGGYIRRPCFFLKKKQEKRIFRSRFISLRFPHFRTAAGKNSD